MTTPQYVIPTIEWSALMPVIVVMLTGIVGLLIEMFRPRQNNNLIVLTSLTGLAIAGVLLFGQLGLKDINTFGGMFYRDRTGTLLQILIVLAAFLTLLFNEGYLRARRIPYGEFYPLAVWSAAGGMLMVSTQNLIMIFIGVEVLSIALYCLAGMARTEQRSEEAALKYFLLGSMASAFLLYGFAWLYGTSGSLDLQVIAARGVSDTPVMLGAALVLVGLAFKASLFPFHIWTPDVYQGAPSSVSAFLASVSKIAAFGTMLRILGSLGAVQVFWFDVLFWSAILTMFAGNLAALMQKDVKRILGYSSVAHAGYMTVALLAHLKEPMRVGTDGLIFYLLVYSVATIGAFAVVTTTARDGREDSRLQGLNGLWRRNKFAAVSLIIFMISLIGMPLAGGFVGKFLIFEGAINADLMPLAIVLAVNSAISVYYYLGIMRAAFVDDDSSQPAQDVQRFGLKTACLICVIASLGTLIVPGQILNVVNGGVERNVNAPLSTDDIILQPAGAGAGQ